MRLGQVVGDDPVGSEEVGEGCVCPAETLPAAAGEQACPRRLPYRVDGDIDRPVRRRFGRPSETLDDDVLAVGVDLGAGPNRGCAAEYGRRGNATGDRDALIEREGAAEACVEAGGILLLAE